MNIYSNFKKRLDSFINKYYKIQLLKGLLFTFILSTLSILIFSFVEYLAWFSSNIRFLFFGIVCLIFIFLFFTYLLIPFLRFFNIGKRLTHKDAGLLISKLFDNIDDSVLNIIELKEDNYDKANDLVDASINQKIGLLDKFDFNSGLNYRSANYYLPYFFILLAVILISVFIKPEIFTEGSNRILHYDIKFEKNVTFSINLPDTIRVNRNDDLELDIILKGNNFPENLFLKYGSFNSVLQKISDSTFRYNFKNVNNDFSFYLFSKDFQSKFYVINIIDLPTLQNIDFKLDYPSYILKKDEHISNIFEFSAPYGTEIEVIIRSQYSDSCFLNLGASIMDLNKKHQNFVGKFKLYKNLAYNVFLQNSDTSQVVLTNKLISVIPDLFPSINIEYVIDDNNFNVFHFKIDIRDDYGFNNLFFINELDSIALPINRNVATQSVFFSYDYSNVKDSTSNTIFRIYDNDIISGFKYTDSDPIIFKQLSGIELMAEQKKLNQEVESKLEKSLQLARNLQKDISDLQKDLIVSDLNNWEKKKKVENILDKQKELDKLLNELAQLNREKNNLSQSQTDLQKEILQKQQLIQENLENFMTDEMKSLLKELEKLQKEFDSKKLNEMVQDLDMNYEELNKELDKNLEQIKKFEIENQIYQTVEELKKLSENQKDLATNSSDSIGSDIKDKNNENSDLFQELMDNYEQILEENSSLENPSELQSFDDQINDIKDSFEKADSSLDSSNEDDNSKEKLNDASKQLDDLAQAMESMMDSNQESEEGENADAMRLLLENLFYFSFTQEELLNDIRNTSVNNPLYIDLQLAQLKLSIDYEIINDSLFALSKRALQISSEISKASFAIEYELNTINTFYTDRKKNNVIKSNQLVVENSNDMILILSESLKNMQNSGGGGGGSPSKKKQKPKKGEPSLGDMRKSQQQMESDLKKMLDQMKQGQKPGQGMSKQQMGQMLAKQEIFQQMLNEIGNSSGTSSEVSKQLDEIKKLMEYNKRDMINMQINDNTYLRQQQIVTRLLEAENAEMERDKDDKRKSKEALNYDISDSKKYFDRYNEKTNFDEIILFDKLNLEPFYKTLFKDYLDTINAN